MPAEAAELDSGFRVYNFLVEIDGINISAFSEVVMPDGWLDVIEYRTGGDSNSNARKLPGRVHYGNLILRRSVDQHLDLWEWWDNTRHGQLTRRHVDVVLRGTAGANLRHVEFYNAFPVRYGYSDLQARGGEPLIETIELAYEDMRVA